MTSLRSFSRPVATAPAFAYPCALSLASGFAAAVDASPGVTPEADGLGVAPFR